MTPLEKHKISIVLLKEEFKKREKILEAILKNEREDCKHEFGKLVQIGWVPDIEIMGYFCEKCGFTKRA